MSKSLHKELDQLLGRAEALCKTWPLNEAQFNLETGWSRTYENLFAGEFSRLLHEKDILNDVLKEGRAILAGRAGDGKTWLLRRLYRQALDQGRVPILLDLRKWTGADYDEWAAWTSYGVGDAADFLIRRFSGVGLGAIELDRLPPETAKILLVDGLNEITSTVGAEVLQLLDELVREQINLSVLVADRLIRRDLPNPSRWSIGTVRPLSADQVRKYLGSNIAVQPGGILTSPFFLDAALKYHIQGQTRSLASERFLVEHGKVPADELDRIAAAAFDAYQESRSRVFDRQRFSTLAGHVGMSALENSQILLSAPGDRTYFLHHILHDYLAARHIARQASDSWTPRILSDLSFDSSSFDAIELVFEQLAGETADLFLRQLYDWNLYAAGYALAQVRDANAHVGVEMRTLIFSMLAEKRFDVILATKQKANDALALMQLTDARPFYEASSLKDVFNRLSAIQSDEPWFRNWRELFKTGPDVPLALEALEKIRSPNSITGWTVANVAKRSILNDEALAKLIEWIDGGSATVRWRIAHVLGAYPRQPTLAALLRLLDTDPDGYVRYGAIRSIIELAARADGETRGAISVAIADRAVVISKQPKIAGELRTCLLMDGHAVSEDWMTFLTKIVRSMFSAIDSTRDRDSWRRCLTETESLYAESNVGGAAKINTEASNG